MDISTNRRDVMALAPASGSGIGKVLAERLLNTEGFLEKMAAAALDGLAAYVSRYDRAKKGFVREPDFKTRTMVFFGLLAQMEGEAVKRVLHQHFVQRGGGPDFSSALRESPEMQEAVARELEKAKFRQRKRAPAVVETDAESAKNASEDQRVTPLETEITNNNIGQPSTR